MRFVGLSFLITHISLVQDKWKRAFQIVRAVNAFSRLASVSEDGTSSAPPAKENGN